MSSQQEDTMHEIYIEVEKKGLRKKFDKQVRKMNKQPEYKWMDMCERWEYALKRIKG
tara:strand:- start:213 stop:383 length:171 start_codon:yes stop_codon:yes gene_type:complete